MNRRVAGLLAATSVGALAFATPGLAGSEFKNKYDSATLTRDCGDGDTVAYFGPAKLWPPNHKLQDVTVTATDGESANPTDAVSNETTLTLADITPEDVAGGDGGPNHDPDVFFPNGPAATGDPSATVPLQLRSERSGKGEGRTYTIHWAATFDGANPAGNSCTSMDEDQSPFTVFVPHDMRGGADWK